jgi:hypothetical protein
MFANACEQEKKTVGNEGIAGTELQGANRNFTP